MNPGHLQYNGIGPPERFAFEEDFDAVAWRDTVKEYRHWSIPLSLLYVILVFLGRRWMENRPAYRLKGPLILWNVLLGGFSLFGAWRLVPAFGKAVFYNGWHSSICHNAFYYNNFLGIWGLFFTLSKYPELGDTLFIVLRKQKLIFLHLYHHASVPMLTVTMYSEWGSPGVWFTIMNYFVHGLMYPYYGLRAAGFRLPKAVAMAITSLQIIQMIMGNIIVIYAAVVLYSGVTCQVSQWQLMFAVALYFSYLILFAHFFYTTYNFGNTKRAVAKPVKADNQINGLTRVNGQLVNTGIDDQGIRKRDFGRIGNGTPTNNN